MDEHGGPSEEQEQEELSDIGALAGPLVDPYVPAEYGYTWAVPFDTQRLSILTSMMDKGYAQRLDDEETGQPYVLFTMSPREVEAYFRGAIPRRILPRKKDLLRTVFESLRAEWRDTGRVRLSLFEVPPTDAG